jgi:adenylate cyclase, class 2
MPTELEAKMKLRDAAILRERLRTLHATDHGTRFEVNAFFDTPDRALLRKDSGLRIRSMTMPDGTTTHVITFKGPLLPGPLKQRTEIEFGIADASLARQLVEQLGYSLHLRFEKRRHIFDLADCEVVLDELPSLGNFIEIEGPTETSVMSVREQLGLRDEPLISTGYATMLARAIERGELPSNDVRFP